MIESFVKIIALQTAMTAGLDKADKWFEKREAEKIAKDQEDALEMNRLFDWLQNSSGEEPLSPQPDIAKSALTSISTVLDNVTPDREESNPMTGFSNEMFEGNITFTDVITHQKIDELGEFNFLMSSITHEKMDNIIELLEGDEQRDKRARREKNESRRDNMFGGKKKGGLLGGLSMLGGPGGPGGPGGNDPGFLSKALDVIMTPFVASSVLMSGTLLKITSMLKNKTPPLAEVTPTGVNPDDAKRAAQADADKARAKAAEVEAETKRKAEEARKKAEIDRINAEEKLKAKNAKINEAADKRLFKLNDEAKKAQQALAAANKARIALELKLEAEKAAKLKAMNDADAKKMLKKAEEAAEKARKVAAAAAKAKELAELKRIAELAEAKKVADALEAKRLADLTEAKRLADLKDAARMADAKEAIRVADAAVETTQAVSKVAPIVEAGVDASKGLVATGEAAGDAAGSTSRLSKVKNIIKDAMPPGALKALKFGKTVGGKALLPAEFAYEMGSNYAEGQGAIEASVNGIGDMIKGLGWVIGGALDYGVEWTGAGVEAITGKENDWSLLKDTDEVAEGEFGLMNWLSGETNLFNHENISDKKSSIGQSEKQGKKLAKEAENKYDAVDVGWGEAQIEDLEKLADLSIEHLDALLFTQSWKKKDEEIIKKILMSKQQGIDVEKHGFDDWKPFNEKLIFNEEITKQYDAQQLKIKEDKAEEKRLKRVERQDKIYDYASMLGWGDDTMGEEDQGRASSDFVIQGQLNQAIPYQQGSQASDLNQLTSNAVLTGQSGNAVYVDNTTNNNTTNQGDHIVTGSTAHAPNLPAGNNGSIMSNRFSP